MDLTRPITSVIPGLTGRVLGVLGRTDAPLTGRALADAVDASQAGVAKVLDALCGHGLVLRNEAGPSAQYVLNREHLAAPLVEGLAELRVTFLDRLRDAVAAMVPAPLSAYLYGSAARGDGTPHSDVDIALVVSADAEGDDWDEATAELRRTVHTLTGNTVGIVEVTPADLFGGWLLAPLRADGIHLGGATIDDLERWWAARDRRVIARLESAIARARSAGDPRGEARALERLGKAREVAGDHDEAIVAYRRALDLYRAAAS